MSRHRFFPLPSTGPRWPWLLLSLPALAVTVVSAQPGWRLAALAVGLGALHQWQRPRQPTLQTEQQLCRQAQQAAQLDHWQYQRDQQQLCLGPQASAWLQLAAVDKQTIDLPALAARTTASSSTPMQQLAGQLETGQAFQCDLDIQQADGSVLSLQLRAPHWPGPPALRCGSIQNITGQVRAQHTLREHQRNIGALAQALPDPLLIVQQAQVIYRNPAAGRLFGLAADTPALPLATLLPALAPTLPEQALSQRISVQVREGQALDTLITIAPFLHEGRPSHLLLVHDITQVEATRRQLQASNRELQAMAQRLFSVQEDERRAISRDLHDDIGQAITAMKLAAHAAIDEPDPAQRADDLGLLLEMADQTVGRLRDLSTLLRPPQLDALGLEAALSWQVRTILRNRAIEFEVDVPPLSQRPAAVSEQTCFRIAQESLTNIVRHAHAGSVQLSLHELADGWMRLCISDDGDGFDLDGPRGLGLAVMRERAQGIGGKLDIQTAPGAGTCITCHLPFTPAAATEPGPGAA